MSETPEITDELLDALADAGDKTTQMERESGIAYGLGSPASMMTRRELAERMIAKAGGTAQFLAAVSELYLQASLLDTFLRERVGPTEDWPLQVFGGAGHVAVLDGLHSELHVVLSALRPED